MDWSKLPDLIAVGLLTWAFASVARKSHEPVPAHWLSGWVLILLHFVAFMFLPGRWSSVASLAGILFLVWAGLLFSRAAVPYLKEPSSKTMITGLLFSYTLFVTAVRLNAPRWVQITGAALLAIVPVSVTLSALRRFSHPLRWVLVGLNVGLSIFLLAVHARPDYPDVALNATLFVVYVGCVVHFVQRYRQPTAGSLITLCGFSLWAGVFVLAPSVITLFPSVPLESEVWNLPKYVVAVGMILLLLEDQIAHNKHLALHDELTGLPNRRLFQDRLASALERARRQNAQAALLMIDLDHFKQVNDSLGHHAGDLLLQNISEVLTRRIRRSDTVARTGGDEFAVILESPTTPSEAAYVAKALLDMMLEPMRIKDRDVRVGASIGVAVFPDDAVEMEALCIKADLRMYDTKRAKSSSSVTTHGHANGHSQSSQRGSGVGFSQ